MFLEYRARVARAVREKTGEGDPSLVDGGEHGDLASTIAFALAKKERKPPAQIAARLSQELAADPGLAGIGVTATGPYLNFTFGEAYLRTGRSTSDTSGTPSSGTASPGPSGRRGTGSRPTTT
jgi:arginyl-tRNA synthetase